MAQSQSIDSKYIYNEFGNLLPALNLHHVRSVVMYFLRS
jgi:hypothetical protein